MKANWFLHLLDNFGVFQKYVDVYCEGQRGIQ